MEAHHHPLREVAGHVESHLLLAHVRASTGTNAQQTNCQPFRPGRWLWVYNGLVNDFSHIKRGLVLAVDEPRVDRIGNTFRAQSTMLLVEPIDAK